MSISGLEKAFGKPLKVTCWIAREPSKNQKEGQEDQGIINQLGGSLLALLFLHGPPGLPSDFGLPGNPSSNLNPSSSPYVEACMAQGPAEKNKCENLTKQTKPLGNITRTSEPFKSLQSLPKEFQRPSPPLS